MTTLATRLAALRDKSGLSAAGLGELAGLSRSTVGMIEEGRRKNPAASTILALSRVLGDHGGWLLSGLGQEPTKEVVEYAVARAKEERGRQQNGDAA